MSMLYHLWKAFLHVEQNQSRPECEYEYACTRSNVPNLQIETKWQWISPVKTLEQFRSSISHSPVSNNLVPIYMKLALSGHYRLFFTNQTTFLYKMTQIIWYKSPLLRLLILPMILLYMQICLPKMVEHTHTSVLARPYMYRVYATETQVVTTRVIVFCSILDWSLRSINSFLQIIVLYDGRRCLNSWCRSHFNEV